MDRLCSGASSVNLHYERVAVDGSDPRLFITVAGWERMLRMMGHTPIVSIRQAGSARIEELCSDWTLAPNGVDIVPVLPAVRRVVTRSRADEWYIVTKGGPLARDNRFLSLPEIAPTK